MQAQFILVEQTGLISVIGQPMSINYHYVGNIQSLRETGFIATKPITNPQILIWKKTEIDVIYSYITARLLVPAVEENLNLQEKIEK